jgi:archaellum component FlaC
MIMEDIQRDLGRMEADLTSMKDLIAEMRTDLKEIKTELAELRGGYKTLLALAAGVGALVSAFGQWIVSRIFH